MTILRTYRTALDPTTQQRMQLSRQAGASRWVYNWALSRWREMYEASRLGAPMPNAYVIHKMLTPLKRTAELGWLARVSSFVVREAVMDVGNAYQHLRRRLRAGNRGQAAGEPRFKSAGRRAVGFRIAQPAAIDVKEAHVKVAGVGWVRLHERGYIPQGANYRGLGCRRVGGRWYVTVQVEEEAGDGPGRRTNERIGLEVGVRVLAQTSDGQIFGGDADLKGLRRAERVRRLWERRLARRYKAGHTLQEQSRGWQEAADHVSNAHARCAQIRRDRLHQITTRIVRRASGATIVMRDMQVARLVGRNGKVGASARARNVIAPRVARVGLFELRRQIEYKQRWRGAAVAIVPSSFPSTRRCSACGTVRDTAPGHPTWNCATCGAPHDRELNSARNLLAFADGFPSSENGGQAGRRKTAVQAAQWPAEPDQSPAEAGMAPSEAPDGGAAALAASTPLGSGNRADGEQSSSEKREATRATGRAVSARRRTSSSAIKGKGRQSTGPTTTASAETNREPARPDEWEVDCDPDGAPLPVLHRVIRCDSKVRNQCQGAGAAPPGSGQEP